MTSDRSPVPDSWSGCVDQIGTRYVLVCMAERTKRTTSGSDSRVVDRSNPIDQRSKSEPNGKVSQGPKPR